MLFVIHIYLKTPYSVVVCICSCGSGLSGECLTDQDHVWVGVDISPSMLGMYFSSVERNLGRGLRAVGIEGSGGSLNKTIFGRYLLALGRSGAFPSGPG